MKRGIFLAVICALLAFGAQAQALLITPSMADYSGNETSQALINDIIDDYIGTPLSNYELYKQDVGQPEANLPLKDSYETTFSNTPTDPEDALIKYTGGNIVGPVAWLLVKDGSATPAWYLFDLTRSPDPQSWNGIEDLKLDGFWEGKGAISHVALYGSSQPVPEPISMLLFGTGLVGVGGYVRRKFKK
jgi:hypothetical protein